MRNRIVSITEKVPQTATLPDGLYYGTWGAYIIEVEYKNKKYELRTEEGVRGIGFKVVVEITAGIATFDSIQS